MKVRLESTQPIFIEDLKIKVYPGTPVWIDPQVAKGSLCVKQLARLGKLKVSQGQRCAMSKDPPRVPYRAGRMSRPNKGGMQKPFGSNHSQPAPKPTGMSAQEAENLATQAAAKAAAMVADKVVQQVVQQVAPSSPQEDDLEAKIQRAVAAALASQGVQGTGGGTGGGAYAGPEEPVFIPTGIVQDDASELKVSSSTSSSGDLDDAAKALRALRKSSKSKK